MGLRKIKLVLSQLLYLYLVSPRYLSKNSLFWRKIKDPKPSSNSWSRELVFKQIRNQIIQESLSSNNFLWFYFSEQCTIVITTKRVWWADRGRTEGKIQIIMLSHGKQSEYNSAFNSGWPRRKHQDHSRHSFKYLGGYTTYYCSVRNIQKSRREFDLKELKVAGWGQRWKGTIKILYYCMPGH